MLYSNENDAMISSLISKGVLKSPAVIEALKRIDRADFVPESLQNLAYEDRPLPIGKSQTISQPYTVAFMLELLDVHHDESVLDLGSGSGWTTALLACMCQHVDAVERIDELLQFSKVNLQKYDLENISIHKASSELGLKGNCFDKILVSCSAEKLPPALLEQLNIGGVMVIPIGQSIFKIVKTGNTTYKEEEFSGFVFVPLIES